MSITTKKSIFDIEEDMLALERIIEEAEGDISDPAAAAAIEEWFAEIGDAQGRKVDGYINLMKKWEMEESAAKAEAEQYRKRSQVRANRREALKLRLKAHMEFTHQLKIETPTGRTAAIQNNGGKAPMYMDPNLDPTKLPDRFKKISITADNDAIRDSLEAGEKLEFAQLLPRGTQLRIR